MHNEPSQNVIPVGYQIVFYTSEYGGDFPSTTFMKGMTEGKARLLYDILKHLKVNYTKNIISFDEASEVITTCLNKHREHLDSDFVDSMLDALDGDEESKFEFIQEFLSNDLPVASQEEPPSEDSLPLRNIEEIDVFYIKDTIPNLASTFEA